MCVRVYVCVCVRLCVLVFFSLFAMWADTVVRVWIATQTTTT